MTGIRAITKSVDSELLLQNARWGPPKNGEFSKSWLMLQQACVSGLCEKFHLYRLEKYSNFKISGQLLLQVHGWGAR